MDLKDLELNDPFWHSPTANVERQDLNLKNRILQLERRIQELEARPVCPCNILQGPPVLRKHRKTPILNEPETPTPAPRFPVTNPGQVAVTSRSSTRADTPRLRHAAVPPPMGTSNRQDYRPLLADYFGDIEKWVKTYITVTEANVDHNKFLVEYLNRILADMQDNDFAQKVLNDPTLGHFAIAAVINQFISSYTMEKELIRDFSDNLARISNTLDDQWHANNDDVMLRNLLQYRALAYLEMTEDPKYRAWRAALVDKMAGAMMKTLASLVVPTNRNTAYETLAQFIIRAIRISIRMRMDQVAWTFITPQNGHQFVPRMVCRNTDVMAQDIIVNGDNYDVLFTITPHIEFQTFAANAPGTTQVVHGAEVIVKKKTPALPWRPAQLFLPHMAQWERQML